MLERWIPLAMLATFGALIRWRIHYQRTRFGGEPVWLCRGPDGAQRWRDRAGLLGTGVLAVVAVLAACGRVDLAAHHAQRIAGIALGFGGGAAMISAQFSLGASWRVGIDPTTRTALVTSGWYRFSRNPIYVFLYTSFTGFALLVPHVATWSVLAGLALGLRLQVLREERWLSENHGDAWRAYAARVGRFVPWLGRIRRQ